MNSMYDFYSFIRNGANWSQFGILIDTEDNDSRKPTLYQITIQPFPRNTSNPIRFDAIVNLFGKRRWLIKANWLSLLSFSKELFDLYQICVRINNMKVFL